VSSVVSYSEGRTQVFEDICLEKYLKLREMRETIIGKTEEEREDCIKMDRRGIGCKDLSNHLRIVSSVRLWY
jgi:hypothetical protein